MASGDILLDAAGNEILDASGNVMLSDGSGDSCCCAIDFCDGTGCPTKSVVTPGCSLCATDSTQTPRYVRLTLVNVATFCHVQAGGNWVDLLGATLNGTWTLEHAGGCLWQYTDTTIQPRRYDGGTSGAGTCSGTLLSTDAGLQLSVSIGSTGGGPTQVRIGDTRCFFGGKVNFVNGQQTYAGVANINGGFCDSSIVSTTTGTATVVFCP